MHAMTKSTGIQRDSELCFHECIFFPRGVHARVGRRQCLLYGECQYLNDLDYLASSQESTAEEFMATMIFWRKYRRDDRKPTPPFSEFESPQDKHDMENSM